MTNPRQHPMADPAAMLISGNATALQAMQVIDTQPAKIALVIDDNRKLIGSVVDGDIRRALLRGQTLQTPVRDMMHKSPYTLPVTASRQAILETMRTLEIKQIPLLKQDGSIAGIAVHDVLVGIQHSPRPNRVVIMAGGKGKRLMPITSDMPKPMVPVGGKPILEWIIMRFTHYGFTNFTLAINYLGHMIEDYFGNGSAFGCHIEYVKEKEFLGTAGALSLLPKKEKHPLMVMNGDILSAIDFAEMMDYHEQGDFAASVCARVHRVEVPYGVIHMENGCMQTIIEKPVYDNIISAGIYVLSPEAVEAIPHNAVTDMPSLLLSLVNTGKRVGVFSLEDEWVDVGRHDDLERAQRSFATATGK